MNVSKLNQKIQKIFTIKTEIIAQDIKPENIIIRKKGGDISDIILADFGLSEHLDKKKKLFKRCGTPGYVAPEILADELYDT